MRKRARLNKIRTYLFNNRIEEYDNILSKAVNRGYKLLSLKDYWLNKEKLKDNRIIILRHDVDYSSLATKLMFELEKNIVLKHHIILDGVL